MHFAPAAMSFPGIRATDTGGLSGQWTIPSVTETETSIQPRPPFGLPPDRRGLRRVIVITYEYQRVFIPEAGETMSIPVVQEVSFPDVPSISSGPVPVLEEFDRIQAAALAFARSSGAPAEHFRIVNPVFSGDEAWAVGLIAEDHPELGGERALVHLKLQKGSWTGVNYGSGLEPPDWYFYW